VLAGCAASLAIAPFAPLLASLALLYPASCLAWGCMRAVRQHDARLIAAGLALMTMHLSWASGFLIGLSRPLPDTRGSTDQPGLPLAAYQT
jgi:succinoglycan biosynthesis protein ExoA